MIDTQTTIRNWKCYENETQKAAHKSILWLFCMQTACTSVCMTHSIFAPARPGFYAITHFCLRTRLESDWYMSTTSRSQAFRTICLKPEVQGRHSTQKAPWKHQLHFALQTNIITDHYVSTIRLMEKHLRCFLTWYYFIDCRLAVAMKVS